MPTIVWIGFGGFAGAIARYGMAVGLQRALVDRIGLFPWGTFAVNMLGCLGLGIANCLLEEKSLLSPQARMALTVGFFGAFTTFSTFAYESFTLAEDGQYLRASLNVVLQNAIGLTLVWLSYRITEKII